MSMTDELIDLIERNYQLVKDNKKLEDDLYNLKKEYERLLTSEHTVNYNIGGNRNEI